MPASMSSITMQKFRSFYTRTKESTSASPAVLHLGHWKAAATNQELSEIIVTIINLALLNSYALCRWTQVTGLLLEKDTGVPHINRFLTLHIIESELNFVMRLIWGRELMKWSEANNSINNNQYGGRKGVQAQ